MRLLSTLVPFSRGQIRNATRRRKSRKPGSRRAVRLPTKTSCGKVSGQACSRGSQSSRSVKRNLGFAREGLPHSKKGENNARSLTRQQGSENSPSEGGSPRGRGGSAVRAGNLRQRNGRGGIAAEKYALSPPPHSRQRCQEANCKIPGAELRRTNALGQPHFKTPSAIATFQNAGD